MLSDDEAWDLRVLRNAVRYQQWIVRSFGPRIRGRVVEPGGGNGNFTRWLARLATEVVVVEPDQNVSADLEELDLPNVRLVPQPLEALPSGDRGSFDTAVLINVLEHIEDDVEALRAAGRLLVPGGWVCVLVPAHPFLYGSLDSKYGHFRRYARREVAEKLRDAGFSGIQVRYINPIGAVGWFLVGRVIRPARISASSVILTERVAVPIGQFLERFGGPFFGQSVLAVAQKSPAN